MRTTLLACLILLGTSCAERAQFQPTENVEATGHGGQPAAAYDLQADHEGPADIHVNVWSQGATRDRGVTDIHLTLELRNTGTMPVELDRDAIALEAFAGRGTPIPSPQLAMVHADTGSLTVAPGTATTVQLVFRVPVRIAPEAISSLRLRWGVARASGQRYVQFTEFRQSPQYVARSWVYYDPVWGFYDPYFYGPPYGVHFGYHVPVRHVIVSRRDVHRHHR